MNQQPSAARGRQAGATRRGDSSARPQQPAEVARIARTFYRPRFSVSIPESYPSFVPGYN